MKKHINQIKETKIKSPVLRRCNRMKHCAECNEVTEIVMVGLDGFFLLVHHCEALVSLQLAILAHQ